MVARPDARMVEVPLEIEAELPRDFEGAALLTSSGLPRKVRIKAQRDAVKLSTAYRADQLLADLVKTVLRGSPIDVEKVQIAARNFVRAVRERRQDGATLTVESNGRGKIDVRESLPPAPTQVRTPQNGSPAASSTLADRVAALERRTGHIEGGIVPAGGAADRIGSLEKRLAALEARPQAPGVGEPARGLLKGRGTAIEAFADGLRAELRERVAAQRSQAEAAAARCDKAAALAMEAERSLGAPQEGISEQLRATSAQVAAREQALQRVHAEVDLYAASDLPMAERLVARLLEGPAGPDPATPLERLAQTLVRAARTENPELRAWLSRAAALCGWELIDPPQGEPLSPQLHVAVDSGGDRVARVAAPGVRRKDRSVLCRARVEMSPEARAAEGPAAEAEEIEVFAEEVALEVGVTSRIDDDTPPPVDERTPAQGLPAIAQAAAPGQPEATRRLATPAKAPPRELERIPGPPFVLPGSNGRAVDPQPEAVDDPVDAAEAAPAQELTELDRDVAAAARQLTDPVGGDDLALADEVQAVEAEPEIDPEWDEMSRGPEALPPAPDPTAPADGDDETGPNRPPD